MRTIKIGNLEIEKELHTDMIHKKDIKIPKGWRLLSYPELLNIWFNHRNKFVFSENNERFDEFCSNPDKKWINQYPILNAYGGSALDDKWGFDSRLGIGGFDWVGYAVGYGFGVRFVRERGRWK